METLYESYKKIYEIASQHLEEGKTYRSNDIELGMKEITRTANNYKLILEYREKYGINIPARATFNKFYCKISDEESILYFDDAAKDKEKGSGKYILWSSDGKQPLNEWLYIISFSTGAHFLSYSYPEELFKQMRDEIKTYGYKYVDDTNNKIYFPLEKAGKISNDLKGIVDKYRKLSNDREKEKRLEKLKKEMADIEKSL